MKKPEVLATTLRRLGRRHQEIGVRAELLLLFLSNAMPGFAAGRPTPGVQPRELFLPTPTATVPTTDAARIVVDVLQNMQTNGFDAQANDGLGGLWLNWRYGTDPLQTNVDEAGNANGSLVPPQQDRLADLRYVQNLWLYNQHGCTSSMSPPVS